MNEVCAKAMGSDRTTASANTIGGGQPGLARPRSSNHNTAEVFPRAQPVHKDKERQRGIRGRTGVRVDLFGLIGCSTATASRQHQMCHSTDEHALLVLGMAVYVWLWWWGQCVPECMRKDSTIDPQRRSLEPS